ncbi:hypothetical protein TrCOL_g12364 [Triparma columacea]|uniref:Uncharacterized protein n=1 Tax=Triparma columacea TaxID=722753 RepID=A0A9W7FW67_9STRA|nr:hypothetical protein TrCOL_g12364 [Triparma columacea]
MMTALDNKQRADVGVGFIMYLRKVRKGHQSDFIKTEALKGYLLSVRLRFAYCGLPAPWSVGGGKAGGIHQSSYFPIIADVLREHKKGDAARVPKSPMTGPVLLKVIELGGTITEESGGRVKHRVAALIELASACGLRPIETVNLGQNGQDDRLRLEDVTIRTEKGIPIVENGMWNPKFKGNPLDTLTQLGRVATLVFEKQKNGANGKPRSYLRNPIYGEPTGLKICPVRSLARIVADKLRSGDAGSSLLATVSKEGTGADVTIKSTGLVSLMRAAAEEVTDFSIKASNLTAHSTRSTFAMLNYLEGSLPGDASDGRTATITAQRDWAIRVITEIAEDFEGEDPGDGKQKGN